MKTRKKEDDKLVKTKKQVSVLKGKERKDGACISIIISAMVSTKLTVHKLYEQ